MVKGLLRRHGAMSGSNGGDGVLLVPVAIVAAVVCSYGVPLENWRLPFYTIAAQRGDIASSPSGMFWDDLGGADVMDPRLWPDSASFAENHWHLEPALTFGAANDTFPSGEQFNLHFGVLSDFRYKWLTVRNVLDVDRQYKHDRLYPWKQDRIAAGRIEEAYLQIAQPRWFVRLGRVNRNWGPFPDRSILLSNNPYSYDGLEWQFNLPFLEFRHLFVAFPYGTSHYDTKVEWGESSSRMSRYLTAHALNFMIGKWAALGLSETVVFSRAQGLPDLQYINPFSPYTVVNTNAEGSGNLMLGLQGWVHPVLEDITLRGQVVFDDIQVDDEDQGDQEPLHWALDAGASWADPLPWALKHHINIEYNYRSKWAYLVTRRNTRERGERYTYLGRSLGYPRGDGDRLRIDATVLGNRYWAVTLGGGFERQDTVDLFTPWPTDSGHTGYRDETPLSERENLEQTISVSLDAYGYFRDYVSARAGIDNRWIRNKGHTGSVKTEYDPLLSLTLSCHYADLFLRFSRDTEHE